MTRLLAGVLLTGWALLAGDARVLWQDPGKVTSLDFGVRPPQPPFRFVREDSSGTQPKLFVKDGAGITWNVKFGFEVKNESFCWRIVRACGYFAEPSFYIAEGQIEAMGPLKRRNDSIRPDGHFTAARFQFRDPKFEFLKGSNWRWDGPPFAGTRELDGLKILIMLFSNWDNKDARVGRGGANTAVFREVDGTGGRLIYAFTDWGSGMGRTGKESERANWRCEDFAAQSVDFVKAEQGHAVFRWQGGIEAGFKTGIPLSHVEWFIRYLGEITDAQFEMSLKSAGASDAETGCFTKALRLRIDQLKALR